jgi:hypothetical protein
MDLSELHRKLIAAARTTPADDRVPYAFEKRIMAQLAGRSALDPWGQWGRALSRGALCCVGVVFLLSVFSYALPSAPAGAQVSLSQDVEQTLLASVDNYTVEQDN